MIKNCPGHTPSGKHNPSKHLPALYLMAKGHTLGKKSNLPGKLTKSKGPIILETFNLAGFTFAFFCRSKPGQRRTPNPQQGRPPSNAQVIIPSVPSVFFVEFDFNGAAHASTGSLTLGFRQGKRYTWNGISVRDAQSFFPGRDFSTGFTLTDGQDIHTALEFFNRQAKRTFLHRAADSSAAHAPTTALVWNPSLIVSTTTTLTCVATGLYTLTVTAADGSYPTGNCTFGGNGGGTHTLITSDHGVATFQATHGFLQLPFISSASFAGSSGYAASSSNGQISSVTLSANTHTTTLFTFTPTTTAIDLTQVWPLFDGTLTAFSASQPSAGQLLCTYVATGGTSQPTIVCPNFGTG
jgi:hypothetical protein